MNQPLHFCIQPKFRIFRLIFLFLLTILTGFCFIALVAAEEFLLSIAFLTVTAFWIILFVQLFHKKVCIDCANKELTVKPLFHGKVRIAISDLCSVSDQGYSFTFHSRDHAHDVKIDKKWTKLQQFIELLPADLPLRSIRLIPNSQRFIIGAGWFEIIIGLTFFFFMLDYSREEWGISLFFFLITLLGIFILFIGKRQWLSFNKETDEIVYSRIFGTKKYFHMRDIAHYSMEQQFMFLHDSYGNKLARLSINMINLPLFYSLLNSQNNEEEISQSPPDSMPQPTGKEYRPKSNSTKITENNIAIPVLTIIYLICGATVIGCFMIGAQGMKRFVLSCIFLLCILLIVFVIIIFKKHRWTLLDNGLLAETIRGEKIYYDYEVTGIHHFNTDKNGEIIEVDFQNALDTSSKIVIKKYFRYTEALDIFMIRNGYDMNRLNQEIIDKDKKELKQIINQDSNYAHKVKVVQRCTTGISLLTIALPWIIVKIFTDATICYRLIMWVPLLNLILPIIFAKLFVSDTKRNHSAEWNENHISFPYFGWILSSLELIWFMPTINIRSWIHAAAVCLIFAAIVTVIYYLTTRKRSIDKGIILIVGFIMLIIGYSSTHYIARGYRAPDPAYEKVTVTKRTISKSKNSTSYYATVQRSDSSSEKLSVTKSTYEKLDNDDSAFLFEYESIFGLDYAVVRVVSIP